ncbi:ABC transporter ATP-binding protein [Cellulomonas hominis]|nr:ABC transporter ATP-binding protein [Cellulomonas hominis]
MIEIQDLRVSYPGGKVAVDGVCLNVPAGGVLALLGSNGAGKSTTMKAIAGAWPISSGTIRIAGAPVRQASGGDPSRRLIGYCPDVGGLPPMMTLSELIGLTLASTDRLGLWPSALELAERLDLTARLDHPAHTFSHGVARRASVLLACLGQDGVLLLDEPFDGVDPVGAGVIADMVAEHRAAGGAAIVSTHQLEWATQVADQIAVMTGGRIRDVGKVRAFESRRGARRYRNVLAAGAA